MQKWPVHLPLRELFGLGFGVINSDSASSAQQNEVSRAVGHSFPFDVFYVHLQFTYFNFAKSKHPPAESSVRKGS